MTFAQPALLLLLWLVPAAVALWAWQRRRGRARLARINAVAGAATARDARFGAQLALVACGAALCVVAAARPRWGERDEVVLSRGRNVVIAVDVSLSMLAEDVRPNRLERARVDLRDLLADLRGDRAALMAFRGGAELLCPLTTDMAFLRQALEGLGTHSASRGETDIGGAIQKALETLKTFPGDHNAILLISDGEDLEGKAVDAAKVAGERGIPVFTVGLGDARGAAIPMGEGISLKHKGEEVVTKLDNQTLLDVATASGGAYIPLQTAGTGRITLGTLYQRHLRKVAAQDLQERAERRKVERYQWFLVPGLLCFACVAFLSQGRPARRRRPAAARVAAAAALLFAAAGAARADTAATNAVSKAGRDLARAAQAAFRAGRYAEAADAYLDAARDPGLDARTAATFRLNGAIAQLRDGGTTNAAATFRDVLRAAPDLAVAQEGLGAALFDAALREDGAGTNGVTAAERVQLLDEAAAAFQQALRDLPPDDARRRNLAAAASRVPALREEAHRTAILEKHAQTPPEQLLAELLRGQRAAHAAAAAALTNDSPAQIAELETAARLQQEAADLWLPLAPQLLQAVSSSVTNQQQLAQLQQQVVGARDRMRRASSALRDLDPAGVDAVADSERDALQFFAMVAPPPPLVDEAILAQTNALRSAAAPGSPRTPTMDQGAALAFTELFRQRFPAWADQMAAAAQQQAAVPEMGTNSAGAASAAAPPALTDEQRAEIEALAAEAVALQRQVLAGASGENDPLPDDSLPLRLQALEKLLRIRELLPKPPSQQQQQEQDTSQNEQQEGGGESSETPKPDENEKQPDEQPPETPETPDEQPDEQQEAKGGEAKDDDQLDEDMQALMERILRQEKERAEAKKRAAPPPLLHERDW